jgi:glycosyltransferase involved in cell wall biosynthesis
VRILLACEFYYPSVGGVQEVMRQVGERLVERGHQVTVATSFLEERQVRRLNGVSIKEFRVSGNLARGIRGEADAYRQYVQECDFDLFMVKAAQQWTFDALIPVLDSITMPKVFVPCGFSGLYEPDFADYFRRMPDLLRKFDHLIFYASDYRDVNFARNHGIANFSILPNGASEREFLVPADPGFRQRHGIPDDAFVALTVGSLTGEKGHRELAEAFALVRMVDKAAVLILNGDKQRPGRLRDRLTRFLGNVAAVYKSEGALRVVKWFLRPLLLRARLGWLLKALGYRQDEPSLNALIAHINLRAPAMRAMLVNLPRPELLQAYLNSDLFVFASNVEYSPLVLYEAAAAGLPFLSVPVGNAEEIARLTGGGEICPAPRDARGYTRPDPATLARHMESLAVREQDRRAYGEAGRRNWREQFTWQRIALRYEDVFVRLLEEKARHVATDARPVAGQQV